MAQDTSVVVLRVAAHRVGVRIEDTVETLRPLPVDPVPNAPPALLGVSVIRGQVVPVIDLRALLGEPAEPALRWVVLRVPEGGSSRLVAVAVDAVEGVLGLASIELPSLLRDVEQDRLEGLAVRDGGVVQVLRAARLLDDELRAALPEGR